MKNWRFRTGFGGVLVLQRLVSQDGPSQEWRDASVADLFDYLEAIKEQAK